MAQILKKKQNETTHVIKIINARSPTLETVGNVEDSINKYSGKYTQREIWNKLNKKVMWQTYKLIIAYLQDINKIIIDKEEKLVYIWNPSLARKYGERKRL